MIGSTAHAAFEPEPPTLTDTLQADTELSACLLQGGKASDQALLDDLEQRTFRFFWDNAHPVTGLVPDRWPGHPRMCSVASVGFALTAYLCGREAGYITDAELRERVGRTLDTLARLPQNDSAMDAAGHRGFFYHFIDMESGLRFAPDVELSSIDTALLMLGVLSVQAYFEAQGDAQAWELATLSDALYRRVEWSWFERRPGLMCMGWVPGDGFAPFMDYHGYDEASFLYILALGSPTHPASNALWRSYAATYPSHWGEYLGQRHLSGGPLFWHQYMQSWIDMRGLHDAFMRSVQREAPGLDYFVNSRRATLVHQRYAILNRNGFKDYGAKAWGLAACDGPGGLYGVDAMGRRRGYWAYRARGVGLADTLDDGTLSPTAALSSLPFAPEIVLPTLRHFHEAFGDQIYHRYGFVDAFNRGFRGGNRPVTDGRYLSDWGWVATDSIGISQGAILLMLRNHRRQTIWNWMKRSEPVRRGLLNAGFRGGWLDRSRRA
ncbi:glucoamylase family protein [Pseudorhodoferax sp.]|uniref:glucoamylase family protein n=1 Tax=Pseudorhodoferax sp. TaxID=1993553 RepID=UPI002DD65416|nr:glucoamylase family protein [Pseudorhodoferax sp.]